MIDPSALRVAKATKPMVQSRRGVTHILEVQLPPLVLATPRFIQLGLPLPPLKPMVQVTGRNICFIYKLCRAWSLD
jgi:hypothetical protein